MKISKHVVVFDAADPGGESAFWAGVLGGRVEVDESDLWHSVIVDGEAVIDVQHAPDHVQPDWPSGTQQQIHLDLYVEDVKTAHDEVMALGARVLRAADLDADSGFQVYADPAGHPFCLCWS